MSDHDDLKNLLGLVSYKTKPVPFEQFLCRLKDTPEIADTAAALAVRSIKRRGEVDIDSVPPERRPYMQMLKRMNIPAYNAFDHVKGSQRTVARIMDHLQNAAANGYQLRLALILKGGPGCGKSFLVEAFKEALEGQEVYSIKDCPVHENPINLLTLLSAEQIGAIAEQLGMGDKRNAYGKPSLKDLVAVAGKPCPHCWSKVFLGDNHDQPNLAEIEVISERLSSRRFGISTWTPDESLPRALRRGSRGVVDMPEMFDGTPALAVLLDATNDRRFAATDSIDDSQEETSGYYPLDAILIGQTNDDAYELFCKNVPDSDKYTRRMKVLQVPYILSVTEEELAYREFITAMRKHPHFDPEALKLAALFAVISRMTKDHEVDIVTRARMYDGEEIVKQKRGTGVIVRPAQGAQPIKIEAQYWSVQEFLEMAAEDEGFRGLNMAQQLSAISQVTEESLAKSGHNCVSAVEMILFLREKVSKWQQDPGLSAKQKEVLETCSQFIKKTDKGQVPCVIEAEYRRVLVRQLLTALEPNFEEKAEALFQKYRLHAGAYSRGERYAEEKTVDDDGRISRRKLNVDQEFLDEMDQFMSFASTVDSENFRRAVEADITAHILEHNQRAKPGDAEAQVDWRTLPKLKEGITAKLNKEISQRLERLLRPEYKLNDDDNKLRRDALARFEKLGYCKHCRETALTYFIDYELWKTALGK